MEDRLKYDIHMAKTIRNILKKPCNFTMDIVEHLKYTEIRVYENEIMGLNDTMQVSVMKYLVDVENILKSYGVNTFIGGVAGDPPRR